MCLAVLCETAAAATYYTSPTGTGDGSAAGSPRAWSSATWVSPGDTVYLLDGSYGSWSTPKSGSADSVIAFAAVNQYGPKFTWVGVSHSYLSISGIDVNTPGSQTPFYGETSMRLHGGSANALLTNITVSGCKIHGPTPGTGPASMDLQLKWVRNVLIEDCEVYNGGPLTWDSGSSAIQLDECEYVTIRGCHIYNFLCGGIRTGSGTNYTFEYNRIHDQRYDLLPGIHGSGLSIHSQATTIRGNVVYDCGNTNPIRFYQAWAGPDGYHDMLVENNVFFETGTTGLKYWGPMFIDLGDNCVIRNNTFQKGVQMYLAKNANGSGLFIYNNLFMGGLGLDNYGAVASQTAKQAFVNWPNVSEGKNVFRDLHAAGGGFQVTRTSFSETSTSLVLASGASWAVGAMFASTTGEYPYQLAEGSPAIDFSDPTHAPSTDLLGRTRSVGASDAGCYEYGATSAGSPLALTSIGSRNVAVGATLTLYITSTGSESSLLEYSAAPLPSGAEFSEQTFTWTPTVSSVGTHQVTFTVSDGSAQDSETITITVTRPNAAPVLTGIGNQSVNENQALSFSVGASDADSDTLTYSATGLPSGATFTGQLFKWTPSYTQAGIYNVTFIASDGKAQDSATITISVANVNRAPALAAIGDRSVDEENTLALTLSAVDPDGTALTYSAAGLPAGANLSGRNFTWTPTAAQVGSHEITFVASDGVLSDSETIQVTVVGAAADGTAPVVARQSPAPGAIQVSLNNLVSLHVTDAGKGVAPESVTIKLDGRVVYQGDTPLYASAYGRCSRSGVQNDYLFLFQSDSLFAFDHEAVVTVNAADRAGNVMAESTYSFATEMRAFGANRRVSGTTYRDKNAPVTVGDSNGNIWAAWHAGDVGARDIYVARLAAGRPMFDNPVQITSSPKDQCDPDLAISADGTLYLVWQDNRQGHWDVFGAVSADGRTFSRETPVVDANDNQTAPAVAVAGSTVFVAWQDDRNGNQDIYVGSSTNAFAGVSVTRVTTNPADQTDPDLAVGAGNTAYLVWTDGRNGQADIYGATSAAAWANVALVTAAGDQTRPAVAVVPGTSDLHLVWVDAASGDDDIWYASSSGLPSSPLTGRNIIDDTSAADQTAPALICTADGKVFVCWQDSRNVGGYGDDADVYFVELGPGCLGTNILIGDGGARSGQTEPAIALTAHGEPYVVWADDRDAATEIYCAATSYLDPTPLYSAVVDAGAGATIGIAPSAIKKAGDLSIVVPAGACHANLRVTISQVENPLIASTDCLGSYDFGPSGIEFDEPVTVTIPYQVANAGRRARAYWYNAMTGALSQQGITEIQNISLGGTLYALQFKTTHFTPYYLVANDSDIVAYSSDDGGGCSMSATGGGSPRHLLVPYAVVVVFMAILRRRDKKRAARNIEA